MRISFSAFDCFNRCPAKYQFQYINKIPIPKKAELFFGSLIHEIVQIALKKDPIIPSVDELIAYLKENWDANAFSSAQEAKQYFDMGQNMIRNFHASLKPGFRNIVATEKRFYIPLNEKHTLSGAIDRIDKLPFGAFEVIDYKTSKTMPDQGHVDSDKQLGIYRFAIMNLWPEAKDVRLTLYYLKHDQQITTTRTDEDAETLKNEFIEVAEKIEQEKEWRPKRNSFCDWCDFQHLCPLQKQKVAPKTEGPQEIDNIVEQYLEANKIIQELEPQIHTHFDTEKIEAFHHKKGVVSRSQTGKFTIRKA